MRWAIGLALVLAGISASGCNSAGASPNQPIAFPHRAHTENQIECAFCHENVARSSAAGLPTTELCGTCHSAMAQDSPATQTLMEYVDKDEVIPWVRLYEVPDFAYFPHQWHVRADVACSECHGEIGTSLRAERHEAVEMETCIACHEQRGQTVDCVACHK